jgi:ADP-ribose pyrophosphatase YjhB (NUDIX family)
MERLDDLFGALAELTESRGGTKATSIRQPAALNRAAQVATELGMDESFSAAANRALEERVRAFARQRAFAAHFDRFPEDRPRLVAVALRRVAGTGHPAEGRADVVEAVAEWIEAREPDWMVRAADETVDHTLRYVEMIVAGVGVRPTNVA